MADFSKLNAILDMGRWAPSGDNTQPWHFEIIDPSTVIVRGNDTRRHCVYDLDGHPSQIALGALLETIAIAASGHGLRLAVERPSNQDEEHPTFELKFTGDSDVAPDRLLPSITQRSVQRRPLRTTPLTAAEKSALQGAVGPQFRLVWLEGGPMKMRTARLMFSSAKIRLTMREAYQVHRDVIEWNARYSETRVPDQALGIDPLTTHVMQFAMKSWERVRFFNRYLAGTWAPRLQMDFLPGLACAGHFVLCAADPPATIDDYVQAGRAVQRFWLTCTHLGLLMQPELTPLIFSRYARDGIQFSSEPGIDASAQRVAERLEALVGRDSARSSVFMGRVGHGPQPTSRSLRKPLSALMKAPEQQSQQPVVR